MRRPIIMFIAMLVTISLSCNAPGTATTPPPKNEQAPELHGVAVSPIEGNGKFTLTATYKPGGHSGILDCTYGLSDQTGTGVGGSFTLYLMPTGEVQEAQAAYVFSVISPGSYVISCGMNYEENGSQMKTSFTVTEGGSSASSTPGGSFQAPQPGDFTGADLNLLLDQVTSSQPDAIKTIIGCWPFHNTLTGGKASFTVSANGNLDGSCSWHNPSTEISGILTGNWKGSSVTFTLTTEYIYTATTTSDPPESGTSTLNMVVKGTGEFIGEHTATGTATWSGSCTTNNPDLIICGGPADTWNAEGTVPWIMEFSR